MERPRSHFCVRIAPGADGATSRQIAIWGVLSMTRRRRGTRWYRRRQFSAYRGCGTRPQLPSSRSL